MKSMSLAAAILLGSAGAAAATGSSASVEAQVSGPGVATHCVVFMTDGSRIVVTYGTTNASCVALGRRCAGDASYTGITFYSSPVYSGSPFRICNLTR
ncbi:MAG TPA: hypothetical protein VEC11_06200 [Allosphingosinicella sp.]|nr:hypothetical protein [Allosphingosinicella sp.]